MKRITIFHWHILSWVVVAVFCVQCHRVCLGADTSLVMLTNEIKELENVWKTGGFPEYYSSASRISNEIIGGSGATGLDEAAAKLFANLMGKEAKIREVGNQDLLVLHRLSSFLLTNEVSDAEQRAVHSRLLAAFLGKLRKEIVPNFNPKPVSDNVAPPAGIPGFAGMAPEAVSDPVAREKYKAAIRENEDNNLINSRQAALVRLHKQVSSSVIEYIMQTARSTHQGSSLIAECAKLAQLTEEETERMTTGTR